VARLPGLALASAVAALAVFAGPGLGWPVMVVGLVFGLGFSLIGHKAVFAPGLDLVARLFLRVGIVVLGTQITLARVAGLGGATLGALVLVMLCALVAGWYGARVFARPKEEGLLAGGATAVCGASASMAIYGVMGPARLTHLQFSLTLVCVALASALAAILYPVIAQALNLTDSQAGFLMGASIHDVAQSLGAGFAVSQEAGQTATVVKLARVALLGPVLALIALMLARMPAPAPAEGSAQESGKPPGLATLLPWFIIGFALMVAANTAGWLPETVISAGLTASKLLLLLAVVATALRANVLLVFRVSWRAVMPVVCATLASFLSALGLAFLLS
jgi:uncharacterized integral membrane protein (TIGR00698 family)